jgi:carboxymethylenebutenolidase
MPMHLATESISLVISVVSIWLTRCFAIRKTCDEIAEQGFLAVAPDLFWRHEPGVDLNVTSEADWQHGLRLYSAYDRDTGVKDVKDTIDAVRILPECNGKVALHVH